MSYTACLSHHGRLKAQTKINPFPLGCRCQVLWLQWPKVTHGTAEYSQSKCAVDYLTLSVRSVASRDISPIGALWAGGILGWVGSFLTHVSVWFGAKLLTSLNFQSFPHPQDKDGDKCGQSQGTQERASVSIWCPPGTNPYSHWDYYKTEHISWGAGYRPPSKASSMANCTIQTQS